MSKTERVMKELSDLRSFYIRLKKRKQPTGIQTKSTITDNECIESSPIDTTSRMGKGQTQTSLI